MSDFNKERELMVKYQIEARGIVEAGILRAFRQIPRELFIPEEFRDLSSYVDAPVPIGEGQTISQPYMVALMTEALKPQPSDKVLEIGSGSGYQAAILSQLVEKVYTIERIAELLEAARKVWQELNLVSIYSRVGDGSLGWQEEAPFDKIVITAAADKVPQVLFDQLKVGGILLAPVGPPAVQELVRYTKESAGSIKEENLGGCRFVPLISH